MLLSSYWEHLNLAQKFNLVSLMIFVISMLGIGWWVGEQIKTGVIHRTSAATALYVENFIVMQLQELSKNSWLSSESIEELQKLLSTTPLGDEIVDIKIWGPGGRVVYGSEAGAIFPVKEAQERAWQGEVTSHISNLKDPENAEQRKQWTRLIETYTPMRIEGTDRVIAVAEFYQTVDGLEQQISSAQRWSWLVVGAAMLTTYFLLAGIVRHGNETIERQRQELENKVDNLNTLLIKNQELHERVRRATNRATTLNESFLKRISAELHDGPAQDLSLSMLRLGNMSNKLPQENSQEQFEAEVAVIQDSLNNALKDMRVIATGLRLPELGGLTLAEVVARVVRNHQRKTETNVELCTKNLPLHPPLAIKITVFRLIQEALMNAYLHAGGISQKVVTICDTGEVTLKIIDKGQGFDVRSVIYKEGHLGILGMRERVESLEGKFEVSSKHKEGTTVTAQLPINLECYG